LSQTGNGIAGVNLRRDTVSRSIYGFLYQTLSIIVIVFLALPNIEPASSAGDIAGGAQAGGERKEYINFNLLQMVGMGQKKIDARTNPFK
jgi:hypothetical protein